MSDTDYAAVLVTLVDRETGEEKPALLYPAVRVRMVNLDDAGGNILQVGKVYAVNDRGEWEIQN